MPSQTPGHSEERTSQDDAVGARGHDGGETAKSRGPAREGQARKSLVEQPFGTMKRWMEQGDFLTRGLEKVRGERRLTMLV
jgi:hypothetical protein